MADAGAIEVKITQKKVCILSESFRLESNELKDLISVLKTVQKSTNDCLTKLTNSSQECGDKSEKISSSDSGSDDDLSGDNDPELSPKRAKLKN